MLVSRNLKNEAIMAIPEINAAVKQGNAVVLIDKVPTSNPEYTQLYFFGLVEGQSTADVSSFQAMLLGWDEVSYFPLRARYNAKTSVADTLALGKVFETMAIKIVDTTTPNYEGDAPRQDKAGNLYVDKDGNHIYRRGEVVSKAELAETGHTIIRYVSAKSVTEGSATVASLL